MNGNANKWVKASRMNLLKEFEITQGYSQPAAGQFSIWKSFMFITNANQWCLLASLLTASSTFEFAIKVEKKIIFKICLIISIILLNSWNTENEYYLGLTMHIASGNQANLKITDC